MERLQLALRRYQQIVPTAVGFLDVPARQLQVWLDEDVCAVLDDYARRPAFREQASWSIRTLRPGSGTPERLLLDRLDDEIVRCAAAVTRLIRHKILRRAISEMFPPVSINDSETVKIRSGGITRINAEQTLHDETAAELNRVEAMTRRWWPDLVNIKDYFEPHQEFVEVEPGVHVQRGEWIVSVNPELLPVGNFIVRCLLKRVRLLVADLDSAIGKARSALREVRPTYREDVEEVDSSWETLSRLVPELNELFRTGGANRLRDACTAATQVYSAFHPAPDLDWLGLDPALVERDRQMIQSRIGHFQKAEMFERIATALGELQSLYEEEDTRRTTIERAVASGGLVIVEDSREVYWKQERLETLSKRSWTFLIALARKAPRRGAVDYRDVFDGEAVSNSAMSTVWGRLKERLPASLSRLVEPGESPQTYRLVLEGHRVHFF